MNRHPLKELSRLRLREASSLLAAGHYAGAYYLAGYSVECALKACIAKKTRQHDFPDKKFAQEVWNHNLEKLAKLAGLWPKLESDMRVTSEFRLNWAVVQKWSEESRYDTALGRKEARDLIGACDARRSGVLPWIRKRW